MDEMLFIAVKLVSLTSKETERKKGLIAFDFNVPFTEGELRGRMETFKPLVKMALKHYGGEIVAYKNDNATIFIRSTREALDDIMAHPYVDSCIVADPVTYKEEKFIFDRAADKAVCVRNLKDETSIQFRNLGFAVNKRNGSDKSPSAP